VLQVTVTLTALLAQLEPLLAVAGLVFTVASSLLLSYYYLCPLTCSDSTTGNVDSAAACNYKPGGTVGYVELLDLKALQISVTIQRSWPC
jgi:hypothetical protein